MNDYRLENLVRQALGGYSTGAMIVDSAGSIKLEGGAFSALVAALSPYFNNSSQDRQSQIRDVVEKHSYLQGKIASDDQIGEIVEDLNSFFSNNGIPLAQVR